MNLLSKGSLKAKNELHKCARFQEIRTRARISIQCGYKCRKPFSDVRPSGSKRDDELI